jgi:outer membrane protein assembly factor BamB
MFSPSHGLNPWQRLHGRTLVALALVVLVPASCWGQAAAEMRRGQLKGPEKASFHRVVFSGDGKLIAAGAFQGSTISVFDVAAAKEKVRLQLPHENYDYTLAFSADCRTLVSAGREDEMIRTWDVVTGKQLSEIKKPMKYFMALSPGGKRAVFSDRGLGNTLAAFDVATGKMLWQVKGWDRAYLTSIGACAFSPDGKTLAIHGGNQEVHAWDAETGAMIRELQKGDRYASGAYKFVTFSPDGKHVATGGHTDDSLHVFEVETGKERLRIKRKTEHGWAYSAAFSPDGSLLAYALDGFILYDLINGKDVCRFEGQGGVFSPDGTLLAVPGQDQDRGAVITLYDMPKASKEPLPRELQAEQLDALWQDLTVDSDFRLQRVFASFRAAPADSATYLGKKLTPVGEGELKRVKGLLSDLDDDAPKTREKAMEALQPLAAAFEPLLVDVARDHESGEVRNRVRFVLRRQREKPVPHELLVQLRAVMVLEQNASAPARQILEKMAGGAAGARVTEEAKQSLERLRQTPAPK